MTNENATFEQWWTELKRLAATIDWPVDEAKDCYRENYDDGDTPKEALAAELSYSD